MFYVSIQIWTFRLFGVLLTSLCARFFYSLVASFHHHHIIIIDTTRASWIHFVNCFTIVFFVDAYSAIPQQKKIVHIICKIEILNLWWAHVSTPRMPCMAILVATAWHSYSCSPAVDACLLMPVCISTYSDFCCYKVVITCCKSIVDKPIHVSLLMKRKMLRATSTPDDSIAWGDKYYCFGIVWIPERNGPAQGST